MLCKKRKFFSDSLSKLFTFKNFKKNSEECYSYLKYNFEEYYGRSIITFQNLGVLI